jgi:hypothetical protein
VFDVMAALVVFGLVEILIVLFIVVLGVMMVSSFGIAGVDNFKSKCPACAKDGLERIDAGYDIRRHRHRVFRCSLCNIGFREEHDGTLVQMRDGE